MRLSFLCLLIFHFSNAFAQNWNWFPPDSIRCFVNPLQDSLRVTGIDFRKYEKVADTTIIDLHTFPRVLDTIWDFDPGPKVARPTRIYLLSKNSNFGNHIIETPDVVVFVFSFKDRDNDSLILYKNKPFGLNWKMFENDSLKIT
ncbi:MAG: hypothetical protein GC181_10860 [Bacteroidetes bacterium]|nr:hypothetical protein [Bacteroidota bacterium]